MNIENDVTTNEQPTQKVTWKCTFVYYPNNSVFFKKNSLQRLIAKIF